MNILDPKTASFKKLGPGTPFHNKTTLALYFNENEVWVGTFKSGLEVVQLPQYNTKHYTAKDLNFNESSIFSIYEDRHGKIWIGNAWGVSMGDKNLQNFTHQNQFGLSFIYDITEDSEGNIWVATMGNGVFRYSSSTKQTEHYLYNPKDNTTLSSNSVSDITETSTGEIWFSTDRGGIFRYNRNKNNFTSYSMKDGLPDDVSYKIIEDGSRNLWFGTNNGLVRFNPLNKSVKVFTKNDGLPSNQFNYKSGLISTDGKLYFGGLDGMIAFYPDNFIENNFIPPVYITKLTISNQEVDLNTENSPLKKSIVHTDKIT